MLDVRIASRCSHVLKHSFLRRHEWIRRASNSAASSSSRTATLRNVSFWGHIDAGKTTLTEKVLYLANALIPPDPATSSSGSSRMLPGDVDSGSTVTDFLEAERQRGITIQSAAVGPFTWSSASQEGTSSVSESAKIMLIDTPGHIDFTIEVERSLRVADGCIVLVDGVEGVESQTEGVWRIAKRYSVRSHVVFINKMDRAGSSLKRSIQSIIRAKLHPRPVLLQLPVFGRRGDSTSSMDEQSLDGLIDLTASPIAVHFYGGKAGENVETVPLHEAVLDGRIDVALQQEASNARSSLIEVLTNSDEELLEETLCAMDTPGEGAGTAAYTDQISTKSVRTAIRRLTIKGEILPVLCGSAAKGVGVQSVLDAIVDFLPSPDQAGDYDAAAARDRQAGCVWGQVRRDGKGRLGKQPNTKQQQNEVVVESEEQNVSISIADPALSLLAFKVIWDKRKGPMTFVRLYSGTLERSSTLLNTNTGARERLNKILFVYADRHVETDRLEAGQVGVLLGLRDTRTGDTLVDVKAATNASKAARKGRQIQGGDMIDWTAACNTLKLRRVNVPPPVFSMSIEPLSKSDEGPLREALDMLIRTDPSLHLDGGGGVDGGGGALGSIAASTGGQMVLSGMGELHLEIARDRLTNEFNARAHLGEVRVSYRETADDQGGGGSDTVLVETLDRDVMGQRLKAGCEIVVRNLTEEEQADAHDGGNVVVIEDVQGEQEGSSSPESDQSSNDEEAVRRAFKAGLLAALSRGPVSGNPITGLHVRIRSIRSYGPTSSPPKAFSLLAAQALRAAMKERGTLIMEPFMNVRIDCDEGNLGKVVGNLTSVQNGLVERVDHVDGSQGSEGDGSRMEGVYTPSSSSFDGISNADGEGTSAGTKRETKCAIIATVPLVNLVRYSSTLRALTKGTATYEMSFSGFAVATPDRQKAILTSLGRM